MPKLSKRKRYLKENFEEKREIRNQRRWACNENKENYDQSNQLQTQHMPATIKSPDEKLSTSDTGGTVETNVKNVGPSTSSQVTNKDISTRDNVCLESLTKGINEADNINIEVELPEYEIEITEEEPGRPSAFEGRRIVNLINVYKKLQDISSHDNMPKVDETTYVRHKIRERKRSKQRNKEVADSPIHIQDESKNVKSEKPTSTIKNLDQKPKGLQNRRESVCARVDQRKQGPGLQVSDAKKTKVDKATYVRYRNKKHAKQESDISIRAKKSVRLFNVTTKTDKSTYVRYHSRKNHGTTNIQTQEHFDDRLSQTKQKQTNDNVRKVDKSTFVRCRDRNQKNLPKHQTTGNDKPKREEPARRLEKCTLVRFPGIDAGKPAERRTVNLEAATQNSYAYDGTGDQIHRGEQRPPNTNVRTNKPNFEAGLVEKAIRFIKKQYRSTFDTGSLTEDKFRNADYLVLEEEKRDSPYEPKTVHAGNISVKRRSSAIEKSEIFIKQLDYECNQVSQSFIVDFGTSAIQHLRNMTRNIASNFIDEDDEEDSSCKCKPADTKDVGHQVDRAHAEAGVQAASINRRKPVNKRGNYTEGAVQTKLPQQLATEELFKCVEKFIYANKYKKDYEDFGAQADVDELHHINRNRTDDQTVQADFPQRHGSSNKKNIKIIDKNNQYADVGVQKDMILFKKTGVQYTNNALQTDFFDGNIIEDTAEVCMQADFEDYPEYQSLICTEQGVQTPMLLDENKTKCRKFKNIKQENASQNVQEYNEQNLISKVFEEKERKRRTGNLSITPQAKIKIQPKEMVQCGVQSDKPPNIDKFQACEKNSNDSALISWFCSDQNILRVKKSAGASQGIIGISKVIEQHDPVERLQLCACPEGETCTNECKLVEMKICTNEKTIDEVNEINLNIRDCDTCENGGNLNNITGLGGVDGAPPVPEGDRDTENKYDTRKNKLQKRQKRKKEEREAKRGKSKTQDEPRHETCDPNKCKSIEQLIENIPCAKIHAADGGIQEADVKRPTGIHIKYKTPQTKYMENYTQPDVKLRDGHGRRLACEGESCSLDYHQLANLLKNIEQNRRQTMSSNSYEPTRGPPIIRHHHWDNPCEYIRTDNTRYRGAQSSSILSDRTKDRTLLGNSRSRSCKCLDVSSLGSQDEMGTQYDEQYQPQPFANPNYKQHGSLNARSPLGPNIDRHRDTHSPHQMPDRHVPNYKYPTNLGRPADEERPYRYETFDGSGMYLSREPYYQYQRKSASETSDCYYKNMLQNVLQKVPLYPYEDYEKLPKCCHTRDIGCDPIPELKQEKRRIWEGLFKKPCCRRCEKTCKISRQEVVDAAAGPCEGQSKRGTNSKCQRRCQLKTRPLPCRFDMTEDAQGEGTWNASSHSCRNLLEYDHCKDFDWVPANYFMQAKSSISEGSSGFTMVFGEKARDNAYLVAEKEECVCDVPSACRQLFKKLKKCCGQTNVPETPSEDKLLVKPSRSQGFKLDVTGKGSQAPGLSCCPDVKTKSKYSYRH